VTIDSVLCRFQDKLTVAWRFNRTC